MRPLIISLLISSLIPFVVQAEAPVATVVKIRGMVTKLLPGAHEASVVEVGDQLLEDTSLVTGAKSFIKIKFVDSSELNMGSDSKIVISEMSEDTPGIISLLKGRIRTEVQKTTKEEDRDKNKFYIRTRTAAMGIRGTDFQTIYNPDNRVTSLLTYKGAVAIAKLDEKTHKLFEDETRVVERDAVTKAPEIRSIPGKAIDETEVMKKVLLSGSTVVVEPGQTSFSSDALRKTSTPIQISSAQLNALYKNRELDEKNILNLKSALGTETKSDVAVASKYNAKTGEFAPKSGGFIDQNTGLYIAEVKNAGDIDADTGQYVAPKGLILDAKKGFVIDQTAEVRPELLALKEDMNKSISRDLVVGDLDGEVVLAKRSLEEKFIRDRLTFSYSSFKEDMTLPSLAINSKSAIKFSVDWQVSSTNRFAGLIGLSYANVAYDQSLSQDAGALIDMYAGLKYAMTNRADLITKITLDQAHFGNATAVGIYQFKRVVLTRLSVGADFEIVRSDKWSVHGEGHLNYTPRKKFNDLIISPNMGYNLKITPQYALDDKRILGLGLFTESHKNDLQNTIDLVAQERKTVGAEFRFSIDM